VPVIKSFRVGAGFDPRRVEQYRGAVAAILLDTLVEGVAGGSGRAFHWESVAGIPQVAPLVVAGGLTPRNVGAAIRALRPCAVDVSSGVEETVRHKDPERLAAFIAAVREADDTREACA
jgi:phosphoribosylanthranilate isomerase